MVHDERDDGEVHVQMRPFATTSYSSVAVDSDNLAPWETDAYPSLECAELDSKGNKKCKRRLQVDPITGELMKIDQEETMALAFAAQQRQGINIVA